MALPRTVKLPRRSLDIVPEGVYAGADVALSRVFSVAFHVTAAPVLLGLALLWPPTAALGERGWIPFVLLAVLPTLGIPIMRRPQGPAAFDRLLLFSYLNVTGLGIIQWLSGGWATPYHELYLGGLLLVALVHPPRRALPFAAFTFAVVLTPVGYGETAGRGGDVAVAMGIWTLTVLFCAGVMTLLRSQRILLLENEREAKGLAHHDALTGLENRRSFDEALATAIERARISGELVALAVGDVNGFKQINDRHGHLEGDRCLDQIADALVAAARNGDRVFRWGGDEFAVLLLGSAASDAAAACDRFERAVADHVRTPDGRPVTVTFGWAADAGVRDAGQLIAAADEALLERKRRRPRLAA